MKRIISSVVLMAYCSLLIVSCSSDHTTNLDKENVSLFESKIFDNRIVDPGVIHNEILTEVDRIHCFLDEGKPSIEEFIEYNVTAINTVFERHDLQIKVEAKDIEWILDELRYLRNIGALDVLDPHVPQIQDFSRLAELGLLSGNDAIILYHNYQALVSKKHCYTVESVAALEDITQDDYALYASITSHSIEYWEDYYFSVADTMPPDQFDIIIEKGNYILQQYGPDSIAALLWGAVYSGWVGLICGIVFSGVASEIYNYYDENGWYDWGDNFPIIPMVVK